MADNRQLQSNCPRCLRGRNPRTGKQCDTCGGTGIVDLLRSCVLQMELAGDPAYATLLYLEREPATSVLAEWVAANNIQSVDDFITAYKPILEAYRVDTPVV